MKQTGHLEGDTGLTPGLAVRLLKEKIDSVDMRLLIRDVENFVKAPFSLKVWSRDFFYTLVEEIEFR